MNLKPKRETNFEEFLKVLRRKGRPAYLPFYEHVASAGFVSRMTGTNFHELTRNDDGYWQTFVDFWLGMGYDCIPMEISLNTPFIA